MWSDRMVSKSKLISAALDSANDEISQTHRMPGPHDDAQSELYDDRLLHAAREYVTAHEGVETIPG